MSNEMKVTGTIFKIGEVVENDAATWKKVELIVEVANEWRPENPDFYKFELGNKPDAQHDNVANLVKYNKVGQEVDVDFNVNVFNWVSKQERTLGQTMYGCSLRAWKVRKAEVAGVEVAELPPVMDSSLEEAPF
jgi:hypothetical protein